MYYAGQKEDAARQFAETASVIAQDLADAKTINVTMAPEIFVNGKPLPSFGFEQFKALADQALADNQTRCMVKPVPGMLNAASAASQKT